MMYHDKCVAIVHIAGRNVNEGGIVDDSVGMTPPACISVLILPT
jgi:hypothetical protein